MMVKTIDSKGFYRFFRVGKDSAMENDRAFYTRRLSEELARATSEPDMKLKALHLGWAGLYRERLGGLTHERDDAVLVLRQKG